MMISYANTSDMQFDINIFIICIHNHNKLFRICKTPIADYLMRAMQEHHRTPD